MKYRAIVYGENHFWRFTRLHHTEAESRKGAERIIKKYGVKNPEIVITTTE